MIFILVLWILLWVLTDEPKQFTRCIGILFTFTKDEIAKLYGVTRPTLSKWVNLFTLKKDFPNWNRCRKVQGADLIRLFVKLGNPFTSKSLTRGQIAELTYSTTGTVRSMVPLKALKLGFGLETYKQVTIYPPLVAQRITGIM